VLKTGPKYLDGERTYSSVVSRMMTGSRRPRWYISVFLRVGAVLEPVRIRVVLCEAVKPQDGD
jgi:hypothetical protein